MVWTCPCYFNVRCTTNCETLTSIASRWVLMSGSSSSRSKICSSTCSIFSVLSRPRSGVWGWRYHDLGDAVSLMQKCWPCIAHRTFSSQFLKYIPSQSSVPIVSLRANSKLASCAGASHCCSATLQCWFEYNTLVARSDGLNKHTCVEFSTAICNIELRHL
mgnify:FL=1